MMSLESEYMYLKSLFLPLKRRLLKASDAIDMIIERLNYTTIENYYRASLID